MCVECKYTRYFSNELYLICESAFCIKIIINIKMNSSLHDSLQTTLVKQNNVLIFSTNKTMNERFKPKHQRSVFVLNNGDKAKCENKVEGRIVFPFKKVKTINEIYSSFNEDNIVKSKIMHEKQLNQLARNRRMVLMPAKLEHENSLESVDNSKVLQPASLNFNEPKRLACRKLLEHENSLESVDQSKILQPESLNFNKPKILPCRKLLEHENNLESVFYSKILQPSLNFSTSNGIPNFFSNSYRYRERAITVSPFYLLSKNRYIQPSLYNWKRKRISKAQLDDEIDQYMAEVNIKPETGTKVEDDSFIQEYFTETEKCFQEYEQFE